MYVFVQQRMAKRAKNDDSIQNNLHLDYSSLPGMNEQN